MSRVTNDVYATQPLVEDVAVRIVSSTTTLLGAIIVLVAVDWRLMVVLLLLPLVLSPIRRTQEKINEALGESFDHNRLLSTKIESTLHRDGVLLARQFGRMALETAEVAAAAEQVANVSIDLGRWRFAIVAMYELVFAFVAGKCVGRTGRTSVR